MFRFIGLALLYVTLFMVAVPLWFEGLLKGNHQELFWASVTAIAGLLSLMFEWQVAKRKRLIGWHSK